MLNALQQRKVSAVQILLIQNLPKGKLVGQMCPKQVKTDKMATHSKSISDFDK